MELTRRAALAGAAAFPFAAQRYAHAEPLTPIVSTTSGAYRGLKNSGGVNAFKGLRYGEDTSQVRFSKPVAARRRRDLRIAYRYGASCPQKSVEEVESEDCLFLNVWTPGLQDGGNRPVMFYIHGGAYSNGSGSAELYDGTRLAEKGDVVVVTVNHRLNAFGYLYLDRLFPGQFPDSGNAGQWDLILALNWFRQNARAFGGNPNRIMVFGQSGGGAKIATMMASPAARGLFQAAATMSGQQVTACGPLNGTQRAKRFLETTGLKTVEDLKTAPTARLLEGLSARDPINQTHGLYFGPVLDERMLTRHPFWPDAPTQSAHIPMILGNTHDETRAFLSTLPSAYTLTWDDLPDWLTTHMRCDISPEKVIAVYRAAFPELSPSDVMFKATTAGRSWRGQVEEANARARQGAPTWVYQFDLPSPNEGGKFGAPHTIDIAHAFCNLDKEGALSGIGPTAQRVADQLSTAFIQLARRGDPNHAGLPHWAKHTLPNRETMVLDAVSRLENDPRKVERKLFSKVPFIQWGT